MIIFSFTYGLGATVLAARTGRFSPNKVVLIALAVFGLVTIGSALAPTFAFLLLTRFLAVVQPSMRHLPIQGHDINDAAGESS